MLSGSDSVDNFIHLVAGGMAGTTGAIATCPLEVVKTRLQSSNNGGNGLVASINSLNNSTASQVTCKTMSSEQRRNISTLSRRASTHILSFAQYNATAPPPRPTNSTVGLIQCLKYIIENEGPRSLFKGLLPNIVGVAPSRAIYFCAYSRAKKFFNTIFPPDTASVHICSASCAGFTSSTATNPIWFIKTRLQLDNNSANPLTALQVIRTIYNKSGILGFYKGISASYYGITETVIHFVIYEGLKTRILIRKYPELAIQQQQTGDGAGGDTSKLPVLGFWEFMICGAISKTIASSAAYPHEVARTRLREEGHKYKTFFQTLELVYQEEGHRGLYRGLSIQLIRQIPNTAIMMAVYEGVVYLLRNHFNERAALQRSNNNNN